MLEVEKLKAKYLLNAISILTAEIQELQPQIDGPFQEIGIHIPPRPPTGGSPETASRRQSGRS